MNSIFVFVLIALFFISGVSSLGSNQVQIFNNAPFTPTNCDCSNYYVDAMYVNGLVNFTLGSDYHGDAYYPLQVQSGNPLFWFDSNGLLHVSIHKPTATQCNAFPAAYDSIQGGAPDPAGDFSVYAECNDPGYWDDKAIFELGCPCY